MAVILQTRCFQMDNCEPDLSFSKYVELLSLVVYMVIFVIFFPGMLNSRSTFIYKVSSLGLGTKWIQQDPENKTDAASN